MRRHMFVPLISAAICRPNSSTGSTTRILLLLFFPHTTFSGAIFFHPPATPRKSPKSSMMRPQSITTAHQIDPGGPTHPSRPCLGHMGPLSSSEKHFVPPPIRCAVFPFIYFQLPSLHRDYCPDNTGPSMRRSPSLPAQCQTQHREISGMRIRRLTRSGDANTVFGSPLRLNLRISIVFTSRTPVRKNPGIWPALPICIDFGYYSNQRHGNNASSEENISTTIRKPFLLLRSVYSMSNWTAFPFRHQPSFCPQVISSPSFSAIYPRLVTLHPRRLLCAWPHCRSSITVTLDFDWLPLAPIEYTHLPQHGLSFPLSRTSNSGVLANIWRTSSLE